MKLATVLATLGVLVSLGAAHAESRMAKKFGAGPAIAGNSAPSKMGTSKRKKHRPAVRKSM